MSSAASRLGKRIAAVLDMYAIFASLMVVGLMIFLVVARYVLNMSIVGTHELVLLFTLQLYMTGALIASRRKTQISVDWLAQRFAGKRSGDWHRLVIAAITLAATVFFVVWSWRMLAWGFERPQRTPTLGLPLWMAQASIVVCAFGCALYAIRDLLQAVAGLGRRQ